MQQTEQIAVAERIFEYIDQHTTAMTNDVYAQPVSEYICPEIAANEHRELFRNGPLCVGMSALLPKPGSYFTHDFSGQPLLVTRAADGLVRAFLNVCRHRGARVAEGCGAQRSLVCPYHAWSYGLDGAVVARPEEHAFAAAPRGQHGLTQLAASERDGLLWVMPQSGAPLELERHLGGLSGQLQAFDLAGFHHFDSRVLQRRMNWKLLVDTFLESYHFCVLHKNSICSIFYDNLTTFDTWGEHFRLVSARRTINEMRTIEPEKWNLLPHMVAIYVLFPNTVLVWQLDHIELWQIYPGPDAPDESVVHLALYTPEPALSESARRHWDNNLNLVVHVVENEDFPVGEGAQKGFHSGAQENIVFGCNEPALAHFHRAVTARVNTDTADI